MVSATITNTGSSIIFHLELGASPSTSSLTLTEFWNLDQTDDSHFTLPSWNQGINPGDTFTFGYILQSPTELTWSIASCS